MGGGVSTTPCNFPIFFSHFVCSPLGGPAYLAFARISISNHMKTTLLAKKVVTLCKIWVKTEYNHLQTNCLTTTVLRSEWRSFIQSRVSQGKGSLPCHALSVYGTWMMAGQSILYTLYVQVWVGVCIPPKLVALCFNAVIQKPLKRKVVQNSLWQGVEIYQKHKLCLLQSEPWVADVWPKALWMQEWVFLSQF